MQSIHLQHSPVLDDYTQNTMLIGAGNLSCSDLIKGTPFLTLSNEIQRVYFWNYGEHWFINGTTLYPPTVANMIYGITFPDEFLGF